MVIVSDTTPIISFLKMDRLEVLKELFNEVLLPEAVYKELTFNEKYSNEAEKVKNCSFFKVVKVEDDNAVCLLRRSTGLDQGESEAIIYTDSNNADLLIVDEVKARQVATTMNLRITGTIGIMLAANERGILSKTEAIKCVEILRENRRYISEALLKRFVETLK